MAGPIRITTAGAVVAVGITAVFSIPVAAQAEPRSGSLGEETLVYSAIHGPPGPGPRWASSIFALSPEGGTPRNLTPENPYADENPTISPDGTRIAWGKVTADASEQISATVSVMGADGSTELEIPTTGAPAYGPGPSYFPDSSRIAFSRFSIMGPGSRSETVAVGADGTEVRLAEMLGPSARDPVIAPDGEHMLIHVDGDVLYSRLDGSEAVDLTGDLFPDYAETAFDFSADGRSILFAGVIPPAPTGTRDLFRMNIDGTGLANLTPAEGGRVEDARFSPDETRVAYVGRPSSGAGNDDIWIIGADGSNPTNVTNSQELETTLDWGRLEVPSASPGPLGDCLEPDPSILGTPAADVLPGTRGADVLIAQGGDDRVVGGGARDLLCGSDGETPDSDLLEGGPAKDIIDGGPGGDVLHGGPGADILIGGPGKDRCAGGAGRDLERSC